MLCVFTGAGEDMADMCEEFNAIPCYMSNRRVTVCLGAVRDAQPIPACARASSKSTLVDAIARVYQQCTKCSAGRTDLLDADWKTKICTSDAIIPLRNVTVQSADTLQAGTIFFHAIFYTDFFPRGQHNS